MDEYVDLRLTSVWEYSTKRVVFSGVPLVQSDFRTRSGRSIVVVHVCPELLPMQPCIGQHWRIHGGSLEERRVEHGDYIITEHHHTNPQKLELTLPHTGEDFIRFLAKESDFKGIGEVKARELWTTFGVGIYNLLNRKNRTELAKVLSPQAIESLLLGYRKYGNLSFGTWLAEHRIPPQIQQRLFKFHGSKSIDEIKTNPYCLVSFGMSWDKVDALAQERFEVGIDDERRQMAAVECALREHCSKGGHTLAQHIDIFTRVKRLLGSSELSDAAMHRAHRGKAFIYDSDSGVYHNTPLLIMERVVAKRLLHLRNLPGTWTPRHEEAVQNAIAAQPHPLLDKQREAVIASVGNAVSTITGGAGTGKTTVLRTVLHAYALLDYTIKAVALSGRAAMRLHESTGFETSTIAKLLREEPIERENKMLLVIDEASMVDLGTMYRITNHIHPSVRILLVGDPHQLPPIGAGLVLADILKSEAITNVELDIVKRQSSTSSIPVYSRLVREGELPPQLSIGRISFHETPNDDIAQTCVDLYHQAPVTSRMIAATRAMTREINRRCQQQFNAAAKRLEFTRFGERYSTDLCMGDPVLFVQNHYDAGVQNGSLGRLVSVEQTEDHYGKVKLDDNGEEIKLTQSLLDSLELGYAVTLHKAQGSQFRRVIVALCNTNMIDRAWLYTAITRAEVELHLVGTKERLCKAIQSLSAHHVRRTHLHHLLGEIIIPPKEQSPVVQEQLS